VKILVPPGYLHPDYPKSHRPAGEPLQLVKAEGWLLRRPIAGTALHDAMGCYPLLCCGNWEGLSHDLHTLQEQLVSVVAVADPMGAYDKNLLLGAFDQVTPFKEHFVIQTGTPPGDFVSASHRTNAMRALRKVKVEFCPEPLRYLDDWNRLFGVLAERHHISGLRRFSPAAFEQQLAIPGMVMFRASEGPNTVGLDLWYVQGDCAQGHLAAFDSRGYELRASYATKWRMIEHFQDKVKWINLGAGLTQDPADGLSQFKRGWATGTKTAWLCGRVLQRETYDTLCRDRAPATGAYFPAYRAGEFS
jgi:hypothetical protein